jgi:hypothetical protein
MEEKPSQLGSLLLQTMSGGQDLPAAPDNSAAFKQWRLWLIASVKDLLKNNTDKLMGILYRIDVSEKKLQEALALRGESSPEEVISDLIIERQIQKIKTRKQQGDSVNDWDFDI